MHRLEIPYFDNTIKDMSGRLIPENMLQDSLNIVFNNKKIKNRYGLQQLPQGLNGIVTKIDLYRQLYSDTSYVVAMTGSDIYYLYYGKWRFITRNFNKGTIAISQNTKVVTLTPPTAVTLTYSSGVATDWFIILTTAVTNVYVGMRVTGTNIPTDTYVSKVDYTNNKVYLSKPLTATPSGTMTFTWNFRKNRWPGRSVYKIAFGYTDINLVPSSEWRTVDSIDSTTQCTLVDNYTGTTLSGSSYVIRLCYSGDIDDRWSTCFPYDETMQGGGDKALLCTNGVDYIQKWQGIQNNTLTFCEDVFNYPNICKNIAFYGTIGAEHIICSNVYDTTTSAWNATAIEVSDAGEISWEDGATYPLFDSSSPIKGVVALMTKFVIYKEKSISLAQSTYSVDVTNPFDIQQDIIRTIGTVSIDTVCDTGKFHIFYTGERIAVFDGFNNSFVDDGVNLFISKIVNSAYISRSFAFLIPEIKVYCLAIPTGQNEYPDMIVIFNYEEKNFTFWKFYSDGTSTLLPLTCKGSYVFSYSPSWENLTITGLTGTASSSSTITISGTPSNSLEVGMRVIPTGYSGSNLYIKQITDATHIVVGTQTGDEDSIDPNDITASAITISGASLVCGFTVAQKKDTRWIDLISEDANPRHLFGGTSGGLYELSKYNGYDTINSTQYGIQSNFVTKDFEFNKGLTCLIQEITLRVALLEQDASNFYPGSLNIEASIDYGLNWSPVATLPLDGTETFMEKKVALHMRGKAIRFRVSSELPFQFENCIFGFNIQGKSFKYDR